MAKRQRDPIYFEDLDGSVAANQMLGDDDDDYEIEPDNAGDDDDETPTARDPFAETPDWLDDKGAYRDSRQRDADDADDDEEEPAARKRDRRPERDADDADDDEEYARAADVEGDQDRDADDDEEFSEDEFEKLPKNLRAAIERDRAELQRLRDQNARTTHELHEARQEQVKVRKQQAEAETERLQAELAAAIDDGDSKKQAELHTKISKNQASVTALEQLEQRLSAGPPATSGDDDGVPGSTPAAKEFARRHRWIGDTTNYPKANEALQTVDSGLAAEGYDASSREYFEELERRMSRKFPSLFKKPNGRGEQGDDRRRGKAMSQRSEGPSGVDRGSRQTRRTAQNRNRKTLTADDRRVMTTFGLDPKNPTEVREFLRNKVPDDQSKAR